MAKQDSNPPPWNDSMSDGCTAPMFLKWALRFLLKYCRRHDEKYHFGGDWSAKLKADDELYEDIYNDGFWGRRLAGTIYWHIRMYTYNFPPGHSNRSWRHLTKGKAYNWLGPGMVKV